MKHLFFKRSSLDREMNEEFAFHLEMQTQAYVKQGLPPEEAKRRALIDFGSAEALGEEARDNRLLAWMGDIGRDIRIAIRGLLKTPVFTIIAVLILALAIGANTAIFGIVNATFFRTLPYPEPDRLVGVWERTSDSRYRSIALPNFRDWHDRQTSFESFALVIPNETVLRDGNRSRRVPINYITAEFFDVLRAKPALGRPLSAADDSVGAPPVIWISNRIWQDDFGADPAIIGKPVVLAEASVEIAGVMPADFRFVHNADIYMPISPVMKSPLYLDSRGTRWSNTALGRLADGSSLAVARAQLESVQADLEKDYIENAGRSVTVEPLRDRYSNSARNVTYLLNGAVFLLLLIACVNIATMLLARGFARSREIAIRVALGATRLQLLRQLLLESVVLSAMGGVIGIVIGYRGSVFASRLVPWELKVMGDAESFFDWRVCLFAVGVTVITGLVFGFVPALRLSRTRPYEVLKDVPGSTVSKRHTFSGSDLLIVGQVALVVTLLVSAGLLIQSLRAVMDTPIGIEPHNVVSLDVASPSRDAMADQSTHIGFYTRILDAVQAFPGVESAALVQGVPFSWQSSVTEFYRKDAPPPPDDQYPYAAVHYVTEDYFRTMGIPLLKGKVFDGSEPRVTYQPGMKLSPETAGGMFAGFALDVVVSKATAERYWPGEDPIGKVIGLGLPNMNLPSARIMGVVGNTTRFGVERGESAEMYFFARQALFSPSSGIVAKVRGDPQAMMKALVSEVESIAPNSPVFNVKLMDEWISASMDSRRFQMRIFTFFALMALILASAGIYGVLSFVTGQRTRDIGVRLALGASPSRVLTGVLLHGLRLAAVGLVIGFVGSRAAVHYLQSQLFGVTSSDPVSYIGGGVVLLLATILACLLPALKAARVEPMIALRAQ